VHLATECAKLAFADREAWYGDSSDVPLDDLLSAGYADERRALVGESASMELRPGSPGGRCPKLPLFVAQGRGVGGSQPEAMSALGQFTVSRTGATRGDTVHVDVVDRWGNLVSATPSGGWLQSSPAIPRLGFCLGTRAQMFWLEPGLPNSLVPGRRPRTTLSPSLALRGGVPTLAFGTPGADQQDAWQVCFWLAHTFGGANLQAAIDARSGTPQRFPARSTRVPGGRVNWWSSPVSASPPCMNCVSRGTSWSMPGHGRSAGSRRWHAIQAPGCSGRGPTRAACKATR